MYLEYTEDETSPRSNSMKKMSEVLVFSPVILVPVAMEIESLSYGFLKRLFSRQGR